MTHFTLRVRLASIAVAALAAAGAAQAHHAPGHEEMDGMKSGHHHHGAAAAVSTAPVQGVNVSNCWIRALPNNLPSAGYFDVQNQGSKPVTLTGIASADFGKTMLHQTVTREGVARMMHVEKVEVAPGAKVSFAPSGYHAMLEEPKATLTPGQSLDVVFQFGEAGQARAQCEVRSASGAKAHSH